MYFRIADLSKLTLAELRESEAEAAERAEEFSTLLALGTGSSKRAEDEQYYQDLIKLQELIQEEILRRKQIIDNLSDLTVLELKALAAQYDEETEYWHEEFIKTEVHGGKYGKYQDEAKQTRNQVRAEIAQRMDFLDGLSKRTMTELALEEARCHQESEKLNQDAEANCNLPLTAEKYRRKYQVKIETRDMLRAEILRRQKH